MTCSTAAALTKQSVKLFEKEAKLMMSVLPLKSSIPKVINRHTHTYTNTQCLQSANHQLPSTGSTENGGVRVHT